MAKLVNCKRGGDRGNQYTGGKSPDGGLAGAGSRFASRTSAKASEMVAAVMREELAKRK